MKKTLFVLLSLVCFFLFKLNAQEKQSPDAFDGFRDLKFFTPIKNYPALNYKIKTINYLPIENNLNSSGESLRYYSITPSKEESYFLETQINEIIVAEYKDNIISITLMLREDVNEIVSRIFCDSDEVVEKRKREIESRKKFGWAPDIQFNTSYNIRPMGLDFGEVFGYSKPFVKEEYDIKMKFESINNTIAYGSYNKRRYSYTSTGRKEVNWHSEKIDKFETVYNENIENFSMLYFFTVSVNEFEKIIDNKQVEVNYNSYLNSIGVKNNNSLKNNEINIEKMDLNRKISDVDTDIPVNNLSNTNYFALIIGNENYQNEIKVSYAINDAKVIKQYFRKTLGIPEKNIRLSIDATFGKIINDIDWLKNVMKIYGTNAKIFLYYAGHGVPNEISKSVFILPVDGVSSNTRTAISLEDIYNDLSENKVNSLTLFLDACFSGDSRNGMLQSSRAVRIRPKKAYPKGNIVVFSATSADETAFPLETENHGLFTYFLLKAMQESKGRINYNSLFEYLYSNIPKKSLNDNNRVQTPSVIVSHDFINDWKNLYLIK